MSCSTAVLQSKDGTSRRNSQLTLLGAHQQTINSNTFKPSLQMLHASHY
jgi:hypothetical protein